MLLLTIELWNLLISKILILIDSSIDIEIFRFPDALEYIHISDQYTGSKTQNDSQQSSNTSNGSNTATTNGNATQQQDALNTSERSVRRVLIVAFNLVPHHDRSLQVTSESIGDDYLRLVLHLIDRVGSFRFASKETKSQSDKKPTAY